MLASVGRPDDEPEEEEELEVYVDSKGHACRAYGVAFGVKVVVIRPDGVVGGLLKGADGVKRYFAKIFT